MSSSSGPLTDGLQCSICLDVFTDPVSTPCGHNFCKTCLNKCWDNSQTCNCPYCKETFNQRPDLKINTTLRELADHYKVKSAVKNTECMCHKHKRPLEMFCQDDQTYVCLMCALKEHKTHNTVSLEEKSEEKKSQLMKTQKDVQQMIQDRIKKIQDIKHSAEVRKRFYTELLELIDEHQKAAEKQEQMLIEDLEQEITELKMRNTELEQLTHTEDHLHLLQMYSSLCSPTNTRNWPEISMKTHESLENLRKALTQLQDTINSKLTQTKLKWVQQYAVDVSLDPDTAQPNLILSDDRKQVRHRDIRQILPNNLERFDYIVSVLGKEGFSSGRFYFEVQVKGKTKWILGVARESVKRKGDVPLNSSSGYWTVALWNENEYWAYASPSVSLSLGAKPQRVGVFVDYEEGLVSFYHVESSSHIYSYTSLSFTDKLYPYFSPCLNDEGKNSTPLIITPVNYSK